MPTFVHGVSLVPQLQDPQAEGRAAYSYQTKTQSLRTTTHRLILHSDKTVELYDHRTPENETKNVAAEQADVLQEMKAELKVREGQRFNGAEG